MFKILILSFLFLSIFLIIWKINITVEGIKYILNIYKVKIAVGIKNSLSDIKLNEIKQITIGLFIFFIFLLAYTKNIFVLIFSVFFLIVFPKIYLKEKEKRYIKKYYEELPEYIEAIISNLKSGISFIRAIQIISKEKTGVVSREFEIVLKKIELGKSLRESLQELSKRIPIEENKILISAINTSLDTGGNLTQILENILMVLKQRKSIKKELETLTSQGILSGIIVGFLPFLLLIVIYFIDPVFIKPLFTTDTGNFLLLACFVLEIIGAIFIKQIITVE